MRGRIDIILPPPERRRGTMQFEVKAVTMVDSSLQADDILATMHDLGFAFEEVKLAGRDYEIELPSTILS